MSELNVHVEHVTRVEGHGNIVLNSKDGKVTKVQWQVPEAPRFFESLVVGKSYEYLPHLTSRICGICSIGHTLASIKAVENAIGFEPSEQTLLLRRLAIHGENLQSHVLHVGYLVAPDLLGAPSVVPLAGSHTKEVLKIVKLHRLANEFSDLVCGRTTHPISLVPGGFTAIPKPSALRKMKERIQEAVPVALEVAAIVKANAGAMPVLNRETEFVGLVSDDEYPLYDGLVGSTDGGRFPVSDYEKIVNEHVVPQSTAKYCKHRRESFMVGALARFNLNYDRLHPEAKKVAQEFGLKPVCHNPFMNNVAQVVEIVHSFHDALDLIDKALEKGLKEERPHTTPRAGRGFGAVEVPRGILFHDYTLDAGGKCVKANCVIPTNQNHANIQLDMEKLGPQLVASANGDARKVELGLEMLVRAYDPCISCSTHYLDVRFE